MAKKTGDRKTGDQNNSDSTAVSRSSSNNGDAKTSEDTTNDK